MEETDSEFTKKLAFIRILLRKPKIVILLDTTSYISKKCIVDDLRKCMPTCTIIKVSKNVEEAFGMDRIVYMENGNIKEDGHPDKIRMDKMSWVGDRLR